MVMSPHVSWLRSSFLHVGRAIASSEAIVRVIPRRRVGMNEHRIHQIFKLSVLLKGAHAVLECVGGVAPALIS
jgi:hypothetical protein